MRKYELKLPEEFGPALLKKCLARTLTPVEGIELLLSRAQSKLLKLESALEALSEIAWAIDQEHVKITHAGEDITIVRVDDYYAEGLPDFIVPYNSTSIESD